MLRRASISSFRFAGVGCCSSLAATSAALRFHSDSSSHQGGAGLFTHRGSSSTSTTTTTISSTMTVGGGGATTTTSSSAGRHGAGVSEELQQELRQPHAGVGEMDAETAKQYASFAHLVSLKGLMTLRQTTLSKLNAEKTELEMLQTQKDRLDRLASYHPDRMAWAGFGYLLLQNAVLFNWTFFRFDWNLVEPITYLLGYSVTFLALAYYFGISQDFTYNNIRLQLENKRREKLYRDDSFHLERYLELTVEVKRLEEILAGYSDLDPTQQQQVINNSK